MPTTYNANRHNVTPVAAAMLLSLTTGLQEIARITEISVTGTATASGVNQMSFLRSTTILITPTAQTPAKSSPTSPAAYTDVATTATTEPVTAVAPYLWAYAINAFGNIIRWVAAPGMELWILGATAGNNEMSLESTVGTSTVSVGLLFEEI